MSIDLLTLRIAIAGFMHDVGKFAERGEMVLPDSYRDIDRVAGAFLPFDKKSGRYTHKHSLYSTAFLEKHKHHFPKTIHGEGEDALIRLVGCHHNPQTAMQWMIAEADRISSGFERENTSDYESGIPIRHFRETRLVSLFEEILEKNIDNSATLKWRYPLRRLSADNIFASKDPEPSDGKPEYRELLDMFENSVPELPDQDNAGVWFEHFESLFLQCAANIPSATVGNIVPDISLYDHCRATSAVAAALYKYHSEMEDISEASIKDRSKKKFLVIACDFFGIQNFIFASGGATNKNAAKLLRGRSFAVSLMSSLAADLICRELGLPHISSVLNAAGRFTIIAQNTPLAVESLKKAESKISEWMFRHFLGETTFGLVTLEASAEDFAMNVSGFSSLQCKLAERLSAKKFNKIDLNMQGGVVADFLDKFDNELGICAFCGKRPATLKMKDHSSCIICRDHSLLGAHIVRANDVLVTEADQLNDKALTVEPIFDRYMISMNENEWTRKPIRRWRLRVSKKGGGPAVRFAGGHIPVDNECDKPKSFEEIAECSLAIDSNSNEDYKGVEALGILKADLDNLGEIFFTAGRTGRMNLSRMATFSRQLEFFFSVWLIDRLEQDDKFCDIYTVFAGGDDLFLVGPWNVICDFAPVLNNEFKKFVAENSKFTISAGIAVHKPSVPVPFLADSSEDAKKGAKNAGRDRITLFGLTVKWDELNELNSIGDEIRVFVRDGTLNTAMLFRFVRLSGLAEKEKIAKTSEVAIQDMEALKWRSYLSYTMVRNIKDSRIRNNLSEKMVKWMEKFGERMRIPLWRILYERRGGSR